VRCPGPAGAVGSRIHTSKVSRTAVLPSNLHVPEQCRAVSDVLDRVGDKWSVLVLDRRSSLKRVGQSPSMTTNSCAFLMGIYLASVSDRNPDRVEYG
jgi:hypothetical protein